MSCFCVEPPAPAAKVGSPACSAQTRPPSRREISADRRVSAENLRRKVIGSGDIPPIIEGEPGHGRLIGRHLSIPTESPSMERPVVGGSVYTFCSFFRPLARRS